MAKIRPMAAVTGTSQTHTRHASIEQPYTDVRAESVWRPVYRWAAVLAIVAVAFAVVQMVIEIVGVVLMGIAVPTTVVGWFLLLQSRPLLGLTELTVFQLPLFALLIPLFVALHAALSARRHAQVTVATVLALVGIAVYLPSNPALAMLSLSSGWAAAANDAQRSVFEAAGESVMAISAGPGLVAGSSLVMAAVVIYSAAMRGVRTFGPATTYTGLLAAAVAFAAFVAGPSLGIFGLEIAAAILLLWVLLVTRALFGLARH